MGYKKERFFIVTFLFRSLVRPILFRFDPEWIHDRTIQISEGIGKVDWAIELLRKHYRIHDERLRIDLGGLSFNNPIGLAAGFDKNGRAISLLGTLGFGHIEVGSVSINSSKGNPRPRLFRLPKDEAIIVNYGVPNQGAKVVGERLGHCYSQGPIGINIVETNTCKTSTTDQIIEEYVEATRLLSANADYITLNLNCPNTSAGESIFDKASVLKSLMEGCDKIRDLPPIFLKLTAHCDGQRMERTLRAIEKSKVVRGFIFNIPPGKDYSIKSPIKRVRDLPGTLCGAPTQSFMDDALAFWYKNVDRERYVFFGSGGIRTAEDAYKKIRLGASLVQIYTSLIFNGPNIVRKLNTGLLELLERDGFNHIDQAVGVDNPSVFAD